MDNYIMKINFISIIWFIGWSESKNTYYQYFRREVNLLKMPEIRNNFAFVYFICLCRIL